MADSPDLRGAVPFAFDDRIQFFGISAGIAMLIQTPHHQKMTPFQSLGIDNKAHPQSGQPFESWIGTGKPLERNAVLAA